MTEETHMSSSSWRTRFSTEVPEQPLAGPEAVCLRCDPSRHGQRPATRSGDVAWVGPSKRSKTQQMTSITGKFRSLSILCFFLILFGYSLKISTTSSPSLRIYPSQTSTNSRRSAGPSDVESEVSKKDLAEKIRSM